MNRSLPLPLKFVGLLSILLGILTIPIALLSLMLKGGCFDIIGFTSNCYYHIFAPLVVLATNLVAGWAILKRNRMAWLIIISVAITFHPVVFENPTSGRMLLFWPHLIVFILVLWYRKIYKFPI